MVKVGDTGRMVLTNGGHTLSYPCRVVATDAKTASGATLVVVYNNGGGDWAYVIHENPVGSGYHFEKEPTYMYRNEYDKMNCGSWHHNKESCRRDRFNPTFIGLMRCEVDSDGEKSNFTFIPKEELGG